MKVPFLDLKIKNSLKKNNLLKRFKSVLSSGKIIEGKEVAEFEKKIARYIKKRYVIGLGSGSSALYLALRSLNVKKGDEVITTPFTWIITINAILEVGAKPIFADIRNDFNIDPNSIEKVITKKTKVIIPMHVGGHMCEMDKISKIAKKHKIHIVEDAAQSICSSYKGKKSGAFSEIAAFSLNPMKMLSAYGECGFVSTNNKKLHTKILSLRHAGTKKDPKKININWSDDYSLNHKIDTIQASFVLENLKYLNKKLQERNKVAKIYDKNLSKILTVQKNFKGEIHGRYLYMVACKKRDKLYKFLLKKKIECKIYYSPLACDVSTIKNETKNIPVARKMLKQSLALPLHENLKKNQVDFVISSIKEFYSN